MNGTGYSRLWGWFSLSYARFLTLPRVLMHEMPDGWQDRMAALLEEYNAAFPNDPVCETRVQPVRNNKLTKWPDWVCNYRHPDASQIAKCRSSEFIATPCETVEQLQAEVASQDALAGFSDADRAAITSNEGGR